MNIFDLKPPRSEEINSEMQNDALVHREDLKD